MFYTYILYSERYDKFYIGHTNDIDRRIIEHNVTSTKSYTSKYRPWVLVAKFEFDTRSKAMKAEKYLKAKHKEFYVRLIDEKDLQAFVIKRFS